jgi:protein O-mannosyl-transferase
VSEAITHYQTALQLRPEVPEAHSNVDRALFQQGDIDQAIAHWELTLSTQPADAEAHSSLGTALLRKRLVGEAVVHYEKSLAITPQSVSTLNNLAWILATCPDAQLRNGARAIELAQKADQLSEGKNPNIIRTLAAAYAETARFNDAIGAANRALRLAVAQGDSALASKLQMEIDLYRINLPRRDRGLTSADPTDKS